LPVLAGCQRPAAELGGRAVVAGGGAPYSEVTYQSHYIAAGGGASFVARRTDVLEISTIQQQQ